jgi:hypothetical protein
MSENRDRLLEEAETLGLSREQAARLADAFFACVEEDRPWLATT